MNLYRINYYVKGTNYKVDATIHILAENMAKAMSQADTIGFKCDGIKEMKELSKGVDKLD